MLVLIALCCFTFHVVASYYMLLFCIVLCIVLIILFLVKLCISVLLCVLPYCIYLLIALHGLVNFCYNIIDERTAK